MNNHSKKHLFILYIYMWEYSSEPFFYFTNQPFAFVLFFHLSQLRRCFYCFYVQRGILNPRPAFHGGLNEKLRALDA